MNQQINEQQLIQIAQKEESTLQSQNDFLQNIKSILKETHNTIEGLKEIQKKPEKMFFNIGAGILIETQVNEFKKCKRLFSENGYKETTIEETIKWLEKRKTNLEQQAQKVQSEMMKTENNLKQIINAIKQIQIEKSKNISTK
jgi:prefoldin subunit 5